jgi:leader peptidase (prepilin peptidase)/N-methyltransferase
MIMGLFIGSFYNVVALRTLKKESLAYPPSHCTSCNHRLYPWDLVPVLSYLFLGGKCRYCKEKISRIYPFGEILTSIGFGIVVYHYGISLEALLHIVFVSILSIATITDLKETIVPDGLIVFGLAAVLILRIFIKDEFLGHIISAVGSFALLFAIFVLSMGRMGGADVKIYALIGLSVGFSDSVASLFYASILSILYHLPFIIKGSWDRDKEIPFLPFITVAIFITYFINVYEFLPG